MNECVLITDGGRGIGFIMAKEFAKQGDHLVLISDDAYSLRLAKKNLEEAYPTKVDIFVQDLCANGAAEAVGLYCYNNHLEVSILVNNAASLSFGLFSNTSIDINDRIVRTNVLAASELTHLFLKGMLERHHGYILNISSLSAFEPVPYFSLYRSSKAFLVTFSSSLNSELKGSGVSVTCLCLDLKDTRSLVECELANAFGWQEPVLERNPRMAERTYNALMRHQTFFIPGVRNKLRLFFLPLSLLANLSHSHVSVNK